MNKALKKTLSIIITILMIVTSVPFAFAAGDGVPLTIDITDKSDVKIGNDYYDEDGYIITGTNKDLIVYVYVESSIVFSNASFKTLLLSGDAFEVVVTLEGDNYLGDSEDYYGGISFDTQHLTIEGGENDTLNFNGKASAFGTSGQSGTLTVNGGKINAVTETDTNHHTLNCYGGFVMNGGEVTLSNNYSYVVNCPVTLNGGELNIISTAADREAIDHKIAVGKGALLTVDAEGGILSYWYGTDIVMADDAAGNESLFVKYNAEGEFVPVYDIKSALDDKTYAEIKVDTHEHSYNESICVCGYECPHEGLEDGECDACGYFFYTITHQPTVAEPYVEINDGTDASYQWYKVEESITEYTDENASTISNDFGESSYDKETGWTGVQYLEDFNGRDFFTVALEAGDTIIVEVKGDFEYGVGLYDPSTENEVQADAEPDVTSYELTVESEGNYTFYTFVNSDDVTVKAYKIVVDYIKIDGEASAELKNLVIGNKYVCEVTYADGETEMSDAVEFAYAITHQPTAEEPYVELNYDTDASYQWYSIENNEAEITDENAKNSIGTYSVDTGWVPMIDTSTNSQLYFTVDLSAGDTVKFEFSSAPHMMMFDGEIIELYETTYTYVAEEDGTYELNVYYDGTEISAIAYLVESVYNEIEGETEAAITPTAPGSYVCEVTYADGTTEMSDLFEYVYAITHQPTASEPYVELNYDTDASYQWYSIENNEAEITDENADTVVYDWGESSYDKETGWTGVLYDEEGSGYDFFTIALEAGETVTVELTGDFDFSEGVGLWDYDANEGDWIDAEEGVTSYEITAEADGNYTFYTYSDSGAVTVKAYAGREIYTEIEGETEAAITPTAPGSYACKVTFADGTTEMSDIMKVEDVAKSEISKVTYTPSADTHNTFTVTVNGRPTMIQFIEEDGGTRTYDRHNKNVTITAYDVDGNEVNSLDRTAVYEVWTIYTNLIGPDVKMRAKYIDGTEYKWEKNTYNFTLEFAEPVFDTEIYESYLEPVTKKGPAKVVLITGADVQGIRFKMPNGTTTTYYADGAEVLEDGKLEFTGKVWFNESGENRIEIYVRSQNTWTYYGNFKHTVE